MKRVSVMYLMDVQEANWPKNYQKRTIRYLLVRDRTKGPSAPNSLH